MHAIISAFTFSFVWKMGNLSLKRDHVTHLYLEMVQDRKVKNVNDI